jgi:hypothetical protein
VFIEFPLFMLNQSPHARVFASGLLMAVLLLPACGIFLGRQVPLNTENRSNLLLIFAPGPETATYRRQLDSLSGYAEEIRLRGLRIYKVFPDQGLNSDNQPLSVAQVQDLRNRFGVTPGEFVTLLLNADGREAARKEEWWSPIELMNTLDALREQ